MARRSLLLARGATMVEYALVIIVIMVFASTLFRQLGKQVRKNGDRATEELIK